jgi:YabP family.
MNGMSTASQNQSQSQSHNIILNNRSRATLDGVTSVISFDERTVALRTALGELNIDGEGLNIVKLELDEGKLVVEGNICGMFYSDTAKPAKRRLFGSDK